MSVSIGSSPLGTLDRVLGSMGSLRDQYGALQQQTSTGKLATSYAGLGIAAGQVMDLTASTSRVDAYTQAITTAQGRASVMQNALTQLNSVVSTMAASALTASGSDAAGAVEGIAQQAREALSQVVSLLNTKHGDDYVFAGADTGNPPVPSPDSVTSSGLFTKIGAQVAALSTTPTTPAIGTVIANTVAIAQDTAPGTTIFSSYLTGAGAGAAPGTIQIGKSQKVSLDLPANRNTGATSNPSVSGTGSAMNDILRSLSVIANGTGAMASNPDFQMLMKNASATLTSAASTLTAEAGQIGLTQNTLTAAAASHASLKTALTTQLSGLTDVDMATTIAKLQSVGTQLQASYNVLSIARNLNLASYLQGG